MQVCVCVYTLTYFNNQIDTDTLLSDAIGIMFEEVEITTTLSQPILWMFKRATLTMLPMPTQQMILCTIG